jgi:hypothetical protein
VLKRLAMPGRAVRGTALAAWLERDRRVALGCWALARLVLLGDLAEYGYDSPGSTLGLGTQTRYLTVPRTLLVLFPIWIAPARFTRTRAWASAAYLGVPGSLASAIGLLYPCGAWAG